METQEKMEREVSLAELFWNIIFGWRQLICFGIIFAVLVCGMKYFLDMRASQPVQNISAEDLEEELPEEELEQVTNARNMKARIEEYENYLENSALMQIDPYAKRVLELQYYVDSAYTFNYTQETRNDYTNNLMNLYYNYIVGGEMSRNIIKAAKLSVDLADISELWSVSLVGTSISIKFTCPEEKKLDAIADSIKEQLSRKETEFQAIGTHTLNLLGESQNVIADTGLADRKNTISNNIALLNTQLSNLKVNMSEQQISLLDSNEEGEQEEESVEPTITKPRISLKYFIVGGVMGVFLVCAWIACKMVFTAKLQSPEEIRTLYGIRLLGEITVSDGKKRFLSAIDDRLWALKNRRRKSLALEQQIKIVSANVALSCKQRNVDCVFVTGSEYEKVDPKVLGMLKEDLVSQNIQVKEGENIFYDANSLKRGTEIGNMLFIEQKGQSIYDEIYNEVNLAKEQNNVILGMVVLV